MKDKPVNPSPVEIAAMNAVARLAMMKFFPSGDETKAAIIELLVEMCAKPEHVTELVKRALSHYNEWPGPLELRGVLCTFAKPKDGVEAGVTALGRLEASIEQRSLETHQELKRLAAPGIAGLIEGKDIPE